MKNKPHKAKWEMLRRTYNKIITFVWKNIFHFVIKSLANRERWEKECTHTHTHEEINLNLFVRILLFLFCKSLQVEKWKKMCSRSLKCFASLLPCWAYNILLNGAHTLSSTPSNNITWIVAYVRNSQEPMKHLQIILCVRRHENIFGFHSSSPYKVWIQLGPYLISFILIDQFFPLTLYTHIIIPFCS